jgi:hypothetical protein
MRRSSCSAPRAHSSSSRSFRSRDVQERNICIYIYMYILYRLSLTRSNNSTFSSKLRYKPFRTAMPRIKQTSRRGRLYLKSRLEPMSTAINNSINRDPTSSTRDLSPASSVVALSDTEEDDCVETKRNETTKLWTTEMNGSILRCLASQHTEASYLNRREYLPIQDSLPPETR